MVRRSTSRGRRFLRFSFVALVAGVAALAVLFVVRERVYGVFFGAWSKAPADIDRVSPAARELVERAFEEVDPMRLVDAHVHLAGIGTGGSGCSVHDGMMSWRSPTRRARFEAYLHASGVRDMNRADEEFVERVAELARHFRAPGAERAAGVRFCIFAFDHRYDDGGAREEEHSELHVPNEWVWRAYEQHPDLFVPVVSIHPYRADAVAELERWAARGVRLVKWLPNAMNIDLAAPRCAPFYEAMRRLDMTLITHTGREMAVEAEELQRLGDPAALVGPLDAGVRVFAAHCASTGTSGEDPAFDVFMRLFEDPRYVGLLYGEISTLTQVNRLGRPLEKLLERPELHARLVNGSDYPLPTLKALYPTRWLAHEGWIDDAERRALDEIYDVNPLLFDFVLKRTVRHPRRAEMRLAPEAFAFPPGVPLFAGEESSRK